MLRKIMLGVLAVGLPVGLLAVVVAPTVASASARVTGTGTYGCSKITGTITFTPKLTTKGTSKKETTKISTTATGCKGGKPAPTKVLGTETKVTTVTTGFANTCSSLTSASTAKITLKYTPLATASTLTGSATSGTSSSGKAEYIINPAKVTGSYPSTTGSVTAVLTQSGVQILTECSKTGLAKLTIASGSSSSL